MQGATLVLRDIHQPPAPPWWPPAPGWWLLAAALLLAIVLWAWFAARRRKRRRVIAAVFDDALRAASTPMAEVAAMSELLRRAARRRDPAADRLEGEAWLEFLDRGDRSSTQNSSSPRGSSDFKPVTGEALDHSLRSPLRGRPPDDLRSSRLSRVRGNDKQEKSRKGISKAPSATRDFSQGPGRLLLDGGYRREVDSRQVAELTLLARARFLEWMAAK